MRFTKMHGLGNDYIYVNCFDQKIDDAPALARKVSDRHFGIGGDGLILIQPSEAGDLRMTIYNADGSQAEMCGNGVRCVAKYAVDRGLSDNKPLRVETDAGVLTIDYEFDAAGKVATATVDMGEPIFEAERIPVAHDLAGPAGRVVDATLGDRFSMEDDGWQEKCGLDPRITCVSMGNPHAIMFCKDASAVPLERVGPLLETSSLFPSRINVHFVQLQSESEVVMRTWERGSGITLACGTGASAVCAAGVETRRCGRRLTARLPGGELHLHWAETDGHVYMTGPATEVFSGEWTE
jgi:diaminopimelate epimerase